MFTVNPRLRLPQLFGFSDILVSVTDIDPYPPEIVDGLKVLLNPTLFVVVPTTHDSAFTVVAVL